LFNVSLIIHIHCQYVTKMWPAINKFDDITSNRKTRGIPIIYSIATPRFKPQAFGFSSIENDCEIKITSELITQVQQGPHTVSCGGQQHNIVRITLWHGSARDRARVLYGRLSKSMGKPEIRPPTTRKWPNRSPSNFALVTTSGSPTIMQNFITMRSGVFDQHIREIVFIRLLFFRFLFVGSSDKLAPRPLHRF